MDLGATGCKDERRMELICDHGCWWTLVLVVSIEPSSDTNLTN
jgi:hypothetical protein